MVPGSDDDDDDDVSDDDKGPEGMEEESWL